MQAPLRPVAFALARSLAMVALAILLILVLLPAALAAQAFAWRRRTAVLPGPGRNKAAITAAIREIREEGIVSGTKERAAARISGALESVFGARTEWPDDDLGDRLRSLADDLEFLRFAPQLGSYEEKLREVQTRAVAILEALS